MNELQREIDPEDGVSTALQQVGRLVIELGLIAFDQVEPYRFGASSRGHGIQTALASVDGRVVRLQLEIIRDPGAGRVSANMLLRALSALRDGTRVSPAEEGGVTSHGVWVEVHIAASPLSITRQSALLDELKRIDALAKALREELGQDRDRAELDALYKEFGGVLEPIRGWEAAPNQGDALRAWAARAAELLSAGLCVAVDAPGGNEDDFALGLIAAELATLGLTMGKVVAPSLPAKALLELVKRAPGVVAVPAIAVSSGTNPYDTHQEVAGLLGGLSAGLRGALFFGGPHLESLFAVQGMRPDPLRPVYLRLPAVAMSLLSRFAVRAAGLAIGGIPEDFEEDLAADVESALDEVQPTERPRVLPGVARQVVATWQRGFDGPSTAREFANALVSCRDVVGGAAAGPFRGRPAPHQSLLTRRLATEADALLRFLQRELSGQDRAIEDFTTRLRTEALSRPLHQPLRIACVGTPGSGKSRSAELLAEHLGVLHEAIDAGVYETPYDASSQLLGASQGIVNSYQSGRLEKISRIPDGVVLEVMDLDHAPPSVRSSAGDLLLAVLETGRARAARGTPIDLSRIIVVFTLNLDGADEELHSQLGFKPTMSREAIESRVEREIARMCSGALLSRLGRPVVFDPLTGDALATILERAIRDAVAAAAERTGIRLGAIEVAPGAAQALLAGLQSDIVRTGARRLLEFGRQVAIEAFVAGLRSGQIVAGRPLVVEAAQGECVIRSL